MREFKRILVDQIPGLMRYALALIGNYSIAEDLVQDTLERALKNHHQWDTNRNITPWLYRILHNAFVDMQRRHATSPIIDADPDEILSAIAPSQPDLVAIRDLSRQLDSLPPDQREVLLMVSLAGLEYKEISQITGMPIGTVMSRLHRARKQIIRQMKWEDETTVGQTVS